MTTIQDTATKTAAQATKGLHTGIDVLRKGLEDHRDSLPPTLEKHLPGQKKSRSKLWVFALAAAVLGGLVAARRTTTPPVV